MPLNLSQKKDLVKEMATVLSDAEVVLTADYSGLTSNELNELRKTTREAGVFVKLVKNNMLKMALKDSQFSSMSENVSGPQIVAVGKEGKRAVQRVIKRGTAVSSTHRWSCSAKASRSVSARKLPARRNNARVRRAEDVGRQQGDTIVLGRREFAAGAQNRHQHTANY